MTDKLTANNFTIMKKWNQKTIAIVVAVAIVGSMLVGTGILFTTKAADESIGAKMTMGVCNGTPMAWTCAGKDENGYLMIADEIICEKSFDAASPNHSDAWSGVRQQAGSNNWKTSCIRKWLNSEGTIDWSEEVAVPSKDNVSTGEGYENEEGFLSCFSKDELEMMVSVTQKSYLNSLDYELRDGGEDKYSAYGMTLDDFVNDVSSHTNDYYQLTTDKIFLLGPEQVALAYNNLGREFLIKNKEYWLRLPSNTGASYEIGTWISPGGTIEGDCTYNAEVGIRPAFYCSAFEENEKSDLELILGKPEQISNGKEKQEYKVSAKVKNANEKQSLENVKIVYIPDQESTIENGDIVSTISSLAPGETKTVAWIISIDMSNYQDGGVYHYVIGATSDGQSNVLRKDSIALEAVNGESNELIFDTDVWHFHNFSEALISKDPEIREPHKLSESDYNAFNTLVSASNRALFKKEYIDKGTNGHCFGMALTTILSKMNVFDISIYSSAKTLREANLDDEVWSILCYYHLAQFDESFQKQTIDGKTSFSSNPKAYLLDLERKVGHVKEGGCPVLLSFESEGWAGHTVVAYASELGEWTIADNGKWANTGKTYNHRILIYDSNAARNGMDFKVLNPIWNKDFCLYFNDNGDWIIPFYAMRTVNETQEKVPNMISSNKGAQFTQKVNDINILNSVNWQDTEYNYLATLQLDSETKISLVDKTTGSRYAINGKSGQIQGDSELMAYYSLDFNPETPSASSRFVVLPDEKDTYVLSFENNDPEELIIKDDDSFLSVKAEQVHEIQFSLVDKEVLLSDCSGEFSLVIANDNATNKEFDTYEINGSGEGDIIISLTDKGVKIDGEKVETVQVAASDTRTGEIIEDTQSSPKGFNTIEFYRSGNELEISQPTISPGSSSENPSTTLNGLIKGPDGKWALYKDGKVDPSYTGIAKNKYGWWRVKSGYVVFNANGIYKNEYGWWKTTNGKVTFKETGIFKNEYGWWRVVNSKVDFNANGIYKNDYGWWKTTNGKVTFKENGVFKNDYGWWKVKNSKVDFNFTGIASNKYGSWYVKNGKVDFSKNGKVQYNGKTYSVKNGKVQ